MNGVKKENNKQCFFLGNKQKFQVKEIHFL